MDDLGDSGVYTGEIDICGLLTNEGRGVGWEVDVGVLGDDLGRWGFRVP
jgi:hypothetical protein